ncbi:hypothetical protein E3N88_13992 [Mikania micrantha]|uniref:Uncharacterized protein n=1 Tax=Mikania micrantha TaxID=192012 RepID=A0A5N6P0I8_9ASTR|nr:hypothetical protein E3N88_13992 [Mikania micrantha]
MEQNRFRVHDVRLQKVFLQIDLEKLEMEWQFLIMMMADLRFVPDHNMTAYLGDPPEKHSEFKSLVEGLILSPVNYAIMEHPLIVNEFIRDFWSTVEEHTDAHGVIIIVGKVHGQPITISEQILRECLQFGDKESDPVKLV